MNPEQQIPFDPDFDETPDELEIIETVETAESEQYGLSPKQAFVAGLISAVLTIGTIGFIILLLKLFYS